MGCSGSLISAPLHNIICSREENIIRNQESGLPFTQKPCRELVNTFRLNSYSGVLNSSQLARALNDLSWNNFLHSKYNGLSTLLKKITTHEKTQVYELCFISILLGKGHPDTKAEIFFNLIDSEANGSINEKQLFNALKDLFELSTETLPSLSVSLGLLSEEEFSNFSKAFSGKQTSVLFSVCDQILNKNLSISIKDFVKSCKSLKFFPKFFDPSSIRDCLINLQVTDSEESYLKNIENSFSQESSQMLTKLTFKSQDLKSQDNDSPSLDYTSSDSSENEQIVIRKKKIPKLEKKSLKPPRPTKKNSEPNSPCMPFDEEFKGGVERWKNNGETKTVKKVRCSSVSGKDSQKVLMKYQLNGKIVEIELRDWEDPIKVAHNFSVKNKLGKRERNSIAVMLSKLQKT